MANVTYPSNLPDFRIGKKRTQKQTYVTTQPLEGALYIEQRTTDIPVIWDVEILCSGKITSGSQVSESQAFQNFLSFIRGGVPFNKSILTEFGYVEHEVRFIEEPRTPKQLNNGVWVYSGVIMAVELKKPDALNVVMGNTSID